MQDCLCGPRERARHITLASLVRGEGSVEREAEFERCGKWVAGGHELFTTTRTLEESGDGRNPLHEIWKSRRLLAWSPILLSNEPCGAGSAKAYRQRETPVNFECTYRDRHVENRSSKWRHD